jgi:hypothetical protein
MKLTFFRFIVCGIFLSSLTFFHTVAAELLHPSPAHIETSKIFLVYFPKCQSFSIIQGYPWRAHIFCVSLIGLCVTLLQMCESLRILNSSPSVRQLADVSNYSCT